MKLVQCWDDGVAADARLADIFRRHGARATFNLNAGLHEKSRKFGWDHQGTEVWRLGWNEMREVYDGFSIANHSATHPRLDEIPIEAARRDIVEGRERLEQFFGKAVPGFAYPFGTYNEAVASVLRDTGHLYARTVENVAQPFPPADPMAFHTCCHFLAPDFWARYEAAREGGVFYFWGHSYEMISPPMWGNFEAAIAQMSSDTDAVWCEVADLFADAPANAR